MKIKKLESTTAFVAVDLVEPPAAVGVVRSARKILQGGAKDLARAATYSFASFGLEVAGASAGISAEGDARPDALAAFVAELLPEVGSGRLGMDPAKGVNPSDLADLTAADTRASLRAEVLPTGDRVDTALAGVGPVVAVAAAVGDLGGRTAVIEGFGAAGPALADALTERGARVVAVATAKGTRADPAGLDPAALRQAWNEHGEGLVAALADDEPAPAGTALATEADIIFVGSKVGAISHTNAGDLVAKAVVPHAPLPVTTKALLMLERAGVTVVPDFIATGGPLFAAWPSLGASTADEAVAAATAGITAALAEAGDHPEGLFLGGCARAESFLQTWQPTLPFGRPLAP